MGRYYQGDRENESWIRGRFCATDYLKRNQFNYYEINNNYNFTNYDYLDIWFYNLTEFEQEVESKLIENDMKEST